MKKVFAILLIMMLFLTGCGNKPVMMLFTAGDGEEQASSDSDLDVNQETGQAETKQSNVEVGETAIPGSWTVPDGWVKAEKYSSEEKIFYVEEGHEDDELPNNISIEVGTNRYSSEEHEQFRDAIVRQFSMQLDGVDATLTGDGSFTDQDYILYTFTISEEDVVTTQFYIVGDQRYCLVHVTGFSPDDNGAAEAAQAMVDSFVWSE